MATLETLISHVRSQSLVEFADLSDQQLIMTINRGYAELAAAYPWSWTVDEVVLTLDADGRAPLPAEFGMLRRVEFEHGFRVPWALKHRNGGYWLFSEAPEGSVAHVEFHGLVPPLSGSQDEPQLPAPYHFILAEYALWKLLERDELYERAAQHRTEYWSLYAQLRGFDDEVGDTSAVWAVGERSYDGKVQWL